MDAAPAAPPAALGDADTPITNGLFLLQDAAASIFDQPGTSCMPGLRRSAEVVDAVNMLPASRSKGRSMLGQPTAGTRMKKAG